MNNQDQAAFWNGEAGEQWVRAQPLLDPGLRVYGEAAMRAGAVAEGDAVLDVGCGCGDTSLAIAARVGPRGRVVGLDVSAPMVARAAERAREAGCTNATFILGDAGAHPIERGAFDLIFSRFGVMFFADPAAAFAHLRAGLRPAGAGEGGGRVAFVCWRTLAENPWANVPLAAVVSVVGPPEPSPPNAPGPFSFGDPARLRAVLEAAGLRDVVLERFDTRHPLGAGERPTLDEAVDFAQKIGPASRLLSAPGHDEATIARARDALRRALAPYDGPEGIRLPAACWVVAARG